MIFKKYPTMETTINQKKFIELFNSNKNINFELINCQLCNSKKLKILFLNDRYDFNQKTVMCKNCGFVFSNPRMDETSAKYFYESDLYRNVYTSIVGKNDYLKSQKKVEGDTIILEDLENFKFSKPEKPDFENYSSNLHFNFICSKNLDFKSVCDIGAGNGVKLMNFKFLGKEVYGVEPSKNYNKYYKKYGLNIKQGSIDNIEHTYDLVLLNHVFEHLHYPNDIIKKIHKITNKYLFIEVPGIIKKRVPSLQNAHNFYFSKNTLNYFVCSNGFELIDIEYDTTNEFILAIYKKSKKNNYNYDFKKEKGMVNKIYYKFLFRNFIIYFLKLLKIEKKIRKIRNYIISLVNKH